MHPPTLTTHHATLREIIRGVMLLIFWLSATNTLADVVKPALVEISVNFDEFRYAAGRRYFSGVATLHLQKLENVRHPVITVRLSRVWILSVG